jgi:hypothetical protein
MIDSALMYSEKALAIGKKVGEPKFLQQCYDQIAHLYKGRDNNKSAEYFELATGLRDSLFSVQKKKEIANLTYNEEERQRELTAASLKTKEVRKQNLQYSAMALGLVVFVLLFLLLSHSVIVNQQFIKFLGILALLIVFEFINLFIHPYLEKITNHSPLLILAIMVGVAALLIPVHHRMEKWVTQRLVEKNKKIRLAAAKKTIAKLESDE